MAASRFTTHYVHRQLVARATTISGHSNEELLTVSSAMEVVNPLLEELHRFIGKATRLEADVDSLRRMDDDQASG